MPPQRTLPARGAADNKIQLSFHAPKNTRRRLGKKPIGAAMFSDLRLDVMYNGRLLNCDNKCF
jgi:hypothetical protein